MYGISVIKTSNQNEADTIAVPSGSSGLLLRGPSVYLAQCLARWVLSEHTEAGTALQSFEGKAEGALVSFTHMSLFTRVNSANRD